MLTLLENPNLTYLKKSLPDGKEAIYLHYVHDPMCAWCWCFAPRLSELIASIDAFNQASANKYIQINYLCGGLAKDTSAPMPIKLQQQIKGYWQKINQLYGTAFNFDFWDKNMPKRATYMANRAVLTAQKISEQDDFTSAKEMISQIQKAYYLNALNPSEIDVLVNLSVILGYDERLFRETLLSAEINHLLKQHIHFSRFIGGNSFPSLIVEKNQQIINIPIDYQNSKTMFEQVVQAVKK